MAGAKIATLIVGSFLLRFCRWGDSLWGVKNIEPYTTVEALLERIDAPHKAPLMRLYNENRTLMQVARGSVHNHQAWEGGYMDHLSEVMNIAVVLYTQFNALRPLPFSLSDLLVVLFLHDLEKPWKYERDAAGNVQHRSEMQTKAGQQAFRLKMMAQYNIELTQEQANGLKYAEGEHADYATGGRSMGRLAAMAHMCDVASARLWHDYPQPQGSGSWAAPKRQAESLV